MSKRTMNVSPTLTIVLALISLFVPACNKQKFERKTPAVVVTNPERKTVTVPQVFTCQIRAQHHIRIRALVMGNLDAVLVKNGEAVKTDDLMFKFTPILKEKREVAVADADLAKQESNFTKKLYTNRELPKNEALIEAKRAQAEAKAQLAAAELSLETIRAPFDGIVEGLHHRVGGLVQEGDVLATLSDNSQMRAYFNVPESDYLDMMAEQNPHKEEVHVDLILASGKKFEQAGKIDAIDANFNNETGTIGFRADFPNPDRLLRHGQTGTVLINHVLNDVMVIPQRTTFELLNKRYVYVVDKDNVVRRREIEIQEELDELFVIKSGLSLEDKIVVEGNREVFDGEKVEIEAPDQK